MIDSLHGVAAGTSFSAPIVAGTIAVMLQHDPTLTEDTIVAALQGGAHPLRGPAPFDDQAGAGEVDVLGAVAAVDRLRDPALALPVRSESWLALGADQYLADGSTPLQAVLELRASRTGAEAPPADGFAQGRLAAYALVDGRLYEGAAQLARRGPGVWVVTVELPPGLGPSHLTVGATFDGAPIVDEKTVPIATDVWTAEYPASIQGRLRGRPLRIRADRCSPMGLGWRRARPRGPAPAAAPASLNARLADAAGGPPRLTASGRRPYRPRCRALRECA